jgi:hypothetical protein
MANCQKPCFDILTTQIDFVFFLRQRYTESNVGCSMNEVLATHTAALLETMIPKTLCDFQPQL